MILGEKIRILRNNHSWSQETFANKMNISVETLSDWENSRSLPDIEELIKLSSLFGVTTDYMLKTHTKKAQKLVRCLTKADVNEYLALREKSSKGFALAIFLCVLSPLFLIALVALSELSTINISTTLAVIIGFLAFLFDIVVAVMIFIFTEGLCEKFEFLETEEFETEPGVVEMVKEMQKEYKPTYIKYNTIATIICILSPIPLIISAILNKDLLTIIFICLMLIIVGLAIILYIRFGVRWSSMQRILQEGAFSVSKKKSKSVIARVTHIFWAAVTAGFLAWSLILNAWEISWIVWPIAIVMVAAFWIITGVHKKDK
ncbi:MAG: helix-turn-helix transcriptional regulator [Ruminococcaceae bacterium]|nr:helix-turn-helix transcriptional regulator [Oscillospiraceae bacterium]